MKRKPCAECGGLIGHRMSCKKGDEACPPTRADLLGKAMDKIIKAAINLYSVRHFDGALAASTDTVKYLNARRRMDRATEAYIKASGAKDSRIHKALSA